MIASVNELLDFEGIEGVSPCEVGKLILNLKIQSPLQLKIFKDDFIYLCLVI